MYNPYKDEDDDDLYSLTMGIFVFIAIVLGATYLITFNSLFMFLYLVNVIAMYYVFRKYYND